MRTVILALAVAVAACMEAADPPANGGQSQVANAPTVVPATGDLPLGSKLLRGSCTTPDGRYTYLVHTIGRYWLPVTQVERGWCHNAAMSVFDAKSGKYVNTVLLDDPDLGAAEPWDVVCTDSEIVVAHSGSSELSFIDRKSFDEKFESSKGRDLSTDMTFLSGIRRRVDTPKQGPRKLVVKDGKVVVTEYFADKPGVTKGELLFNDARACFQRWQSCATCHPDGGTDNQEWSFPKGDGFREPEASCDLKNSKKPYNRKMVHDVQVALFVDPESGNAEEMTKYVESLMSPNAAKTTGDKR